MRKILIYILLLIPLFSFGQGLNLLPVTLSSTGNWMFTDTVIKAIYDRTRTDGVLKDYSGKDMVYWDLKVGHTTYAAERASGYTIPYEVYVITATTANFFFPNCKVGDYYIGLVSPWKTLSASNKVKKVLGNHLTQPDSTLRATNGIFNGTSHFMQTVPFTYTRPENVFFVGKQITWTSNDRLFDGFTYQGATCRQATASPGFLIDAFSGTMGVNNDLALNTLGIIRACFNTNYGKLIVNNSKLQIHPVGTYNMGGFTLGANANGTQQGNIYFAGGVLTGDLKSEEYEVSIYNYLNSLYNLGLPDTRNTFDNGKFVIGLDGATDPVNAALPILIDLGCKATIYAEPDHLMNGGNGLMDWTDLAAWRTAGMDIQDHPDSSYTGHTLTYDTSIYRTINNQFISHGFAAPQHSAYMGNTADANFRAANALMRKSGRGGAAGYLVDVSNYLEFRKPGTNYQYLFAANIGTLTYAQIRDELIAAKKYKGAYLGYFHGINAVGGDNGLTEAELRAIKHCADSVGVDIITHDQLYNLMQH
jgi:hypothetical protein